MSIRITGKLAEVHSTADLTRKFCPRCGSQIFAERKSNPEAMAIALGTFDDLKGLHPTEHVWVSDKQNWLILPSGTRQHQEMPPR